MVSSCSRKPGETLQRLAILPGNILIADPSSEWMRLGIPVVLAQDLGSSRNLVPIVAPNESSVYQAGGTETLRITVQEHAKRLTVQAILADVATQRTRRVLTTRTSLSSLLSSLDALARHIDRRAVSYSTHSDRALQAFVVGFSSSDTQMKLQQFRDAIVADPSFGLGYIALIETLASANSPEAPAVLHDALAHRDAFTQTDKARLDLLGGRLNRAPLQQQIEAETALVALIPNDPDALGSMASNLFLTGKGAEAERLMQRALEISPQNANLRQQLAVGLIETKQFAQAEKVLNSLSNNPSILPQLAVCILLEGDPHRAGQTIEKFVSSVPNPDAKVLLGASWQALAGNLPQAIRQIKEASFTDPRIAALAQTPAVTWQVMQKQYADAKQTGLAASQGHNAVGQIALLLGTGAQNADEWRAKVQALPPAVADQSGKALLTAYGLFLYGFYGQAAAAFQQIDQETGGANLPMRTMFAASLKAASRADEARKILVQPFVPELGDFYGAIAFNQLRALLGQTG